jgi:hypothetical protein
LSKPGLADWARGGFRAALFRADGSVHIWLDPGVLAKLKALRGPGRQRRHLAVGGGR